MGLEEKYPDLAFLTAVSELDSEAFEWIDYSGPSEFGDVEVIYVYGFSPNIGPLLEWVKGDYRRDIVIIEDNLQVVQQLLDDGDQGVLDSDQIHLRFWMDGVSLDSFAYEVIREFPFEKIFFIDLKDSQEEFETLKLIFMRKSVIETAVQNEMLQSHKLFHNLLANFQNLNKAFDVGKWKGVLKGKPAIICGAGPSLGGVIEDLRKVENRALVFAGGSAIVALNAKEIFPDLIFAIDPNVEEFTRLGLHTSFKTPMIYGNRVRPEIFHSFAGPSGYLVTGTGGLVESWLEDELGIEDPKVLAALSEEALSVTCVSVMTAIYFGCNPIILAGVDLSYGDGKRYPDGVISDLHCSLEEEENKASEMLHVKEGKVTATKWIMERDAISDVMHDHPEITFIDATAKGLKFDPAQVLDNWTDSLKEVFDPKSMIHEQVVTTSLDVSKEDVLDKIEQFRKSLDSCDQIIEQIQSELTTLSKLDDGRYETAMIATYVMDLEMEIAYNLVLAPASYAWSFPLSKEARGGESKQSELLFKTKLYSRLRSIISEYLTQIKRL